jgi:hypothetical protein
MGVFAMFDRRWTIGVLAVALTGGCRVKESRRPSCPDGACIEAGGLTTSDACPFPSAAWQEVPVVNLPQQARCRNYAGGSCVIASTVSLFRWQGRDDLAELFRRAYSGGQSASSLHAKLDANRVRYAYTTSGDAAFLEWACRTRRGAGITYFANHFVCLVHLDGERAILLDNNRVAQYLTLPRDEFLSRWRGYGGWATTPVYSPAAPLAFIAKR